MANSFVKMTDIKFDESLEKFDNNLVVSKETDLYTSNKTAMEQSNYTCYVPQPYISTVGNGLDASGTDGDSTQLSVPLQVNFEKHVRKDFNIKDLNDPSQLQKVTDSALQSLGSQVNTDVLTKVSNEGANVVKRTAAAEGFDDVSQADSMFNEIGVVHGDRSLFLSSRDYNSMGDNLATRNNLQKGITQTAYERALLSNDVSGFRTFKMDTGNRLTAAAGTTVVMNGANQYYTPSSMSTAATGETAPVDNRFQTIAITVGGGTVAVGDCFTIAGVNSVHHISKQDTGQLKTFRIVSIETGAGGSGTVRITPPIISNGGATSAEADYQNVTATPANGAALTFLNTTTASVNPFFVRDAVKILPGDYTVPSNAGANVMSGITDNKIRVTMTEEIDSKTGIVTYIWRAFYGITVAQPEMAGIILFNQA